MKSQVNIVKQTSLKNLPKKQTLQVNQAELELTGSVNTTDRDTGNKTAIGNI